MMSKHLKFLSRFSRCLKGATAVEYGLITAAIAVAISAVVFTIGTDLAAVFQSLSTSIGG